MSEVLSYWILAGFQFGVLLALYFLVNGISVSKWTPLKLFQPINWFLLFYLLGFFVVQLLLPFHDFDILGFEGTGISTKIHASVKAQLVLSLFLFTVFLAILTMRVHTLPRKSSWSHGKGTTTMSRYLANLMLLLGVTSSIMLSARFSDGPRSMLVKTGEGKLLYALTFWGTFASSVLAAHNLILRRYGRALVIMALVGYTVFQLGGRGRVLWPVVHTFIFYWIVTNRQITWKRILPASIMGFLVLQALDPLLALERGAGLDMVLSKFRQSLDVTELFMQRTFDGFHNLAVITYYDAIPHDLKVLMGGSGDLFMSQYFPEVYSRGVGFPATLPGELWIAGGPWFVFWGALGFGVLLSVVSAAYWRIGSARWLWLYVVFIPWLFNPSAAYFDQLAKMLAAVAPAVCYGLIDKYSRVERSCARRYKKVGAYQ